MNNSHKPARVEVVIVNWERPLDTIQCIQSVMESDYPDIDIIVVDNGSTDDSVQKISSKFSNITLIQLPKNLGFTGGYNSGIKSALIKKPSHILLINNDAVIEPGTIQKLVNSPWDVAVPKITHFDNPNLIWAAGARWRSFPPTIKMIGYQDQDSQKYNIPHPLDYATGCALMIKTEVFSKVRGFDSQFISYMEDYDFSYRVKESGFSMGYVPDSKVLHKVSQTLGTHSAQRWHYLGRNTVLFYNKGNRFPRYTMWIALGWIFLREIILGNSSQLPHFYQGIKEGLKISSQ
jgi:GT2 family glycosyltransferase